MKINGPNYTNLNNPYNRVSQNQAGMKKEVKKEDQIEISAEAKKLQENEELNTKRADYVQSIKNQIDAGEYQVDSVEVAKKMIEFWSKK